MATSEKKLVHQDFYDAVREGKMDLFSTPEAKKLVFDYYICSLASNCGHFDMLKALKEKGWPWDHRVYEGAIRHQRLDILKWIRENECPFDEVVFSWAAFFGNIDVLEWLKEQRCPHYNDASVIWNATQSGSIPTITWVMNNGFILDKEGLLKGILNRDDLTILKWAVEQKYIEPNIELCNSAAKNSAYKVLVWLNTLGFQPSEVQTKEPEKRDSYHKEDSEEEPRTYEKKPTLDPQPSDKHKKEKKIGATIIVHGAFDEPSRLVEIPE
jgi:hypothetical protein